jgi:hypothetical protein
MKSYLLLLPFLAISCTSKHIDITGSWKLISGTSIAKGDTTTTDYTKDQEMIKIINATHFSFLSHGTTFTAGGGRYTLTGDQYTEHLDFFADKNWEGKTFTFTVTLHGDTLIQKGIEKVEGAGVDHEIIERYIKIK